MFGSKVSGRDAQRRTKTAVALGDASLPGAAEAFAAGDASFEHVAALAAIKDRLPAGAARSMVSLAKVLPPDKFARALQRAALPAEEVGDASTGTTDRGGRWLRFGYGGCEGTIVLNGLEAVMDRAWGRDHPDRADEKLEQGRCECRRTCRPMMFRTREPMMLRDAKRRSFDVSLVERVMWSRGFCCPRPPWPCRTRLGCGRSRPRCRRDQSRRRCNRSGRACRSVAT